MLLLEFDRGLLKFKLNTPALEPLFQFPPRIAHRHAHTWYVPNGGYFAVSSDFL